MNKKDINEVFGTLKTKKSTENLLRENSDEEERIFTTLASEKSLAKDWNSQEEDKTWKKLKSKK